GLTYRAPPFFQPGFAGMYLLATTNKRNDDGPTRGSLHDVQHERGLRAYEAWVALGELLCVPCALGFVEYDDVFERRCIGALNCVLVDELVHILHHGLGAPLGFGLRPSSTRTVARERLAKHAHEWAVAGKV